MKKIGAAVAAALLLATAGCGSSRPSADDISKSLQKGAKVQGSEIKVSKKQADCIAKLLVKSDISDDALNAIKDRDTKYKASSADKKALDKIGPDAAKCVTG